MIIFCVLVYLTVVAICVWGKPKAKRIALLCGVVFSELAVCYGFSVSMLISLLFVVIGDVCIYFYSIQTRAVSAQQKQKNKYVAAALAAFLGAVGAHKFYLRKNTLGAVYLFFYWTAVPMFAGFVEAIVLLVMSQKEFDARYNSKPHAVVENHRFVKPTVEPKSHVSGGEVVDSNLISIPIGSAETVGCEENFTITIHNKDGKKYVFPVIDGQICGFELYGHGVKTSGTYEVG